MESYPACALAPRRVTMIATTANAAKATATMPIFFMPELLPVMIRLTTPKYAAAACAHIPISSTKRPVLIDVNYCAAMAACGRAMTTEVLPEFISS